MQRDSGDTGLIPGLRKTPGGGNGNHSSILAWRIPWTEEFRLYCRLQTVLWATDHRVAKKSDVTE